MEAKPDIKSFLIPIDIKKEIKVIEDAALRIIKNAMRHGHVAIVSNGKRPWLEVGMEILMPRLHKLCLFIDVTKQRVVYPKNKVLLISARNPIYASDQSKIPIAQALIDCLPNDIQVCSIGDNPADLSNVECCLKNPQNFTGKKLPFLLLEPRELAKKLDEIALPGSE